MLEADLIVANSINRLVQINNAISSCEGTRLDSEASFIIKLLARMACT
jgi:hypothetical protein